MLAVLAITVILIIPALGFGAFTWSWYLSQKKQHPNGASLPLAMLLITLFMLLGLIVFAVRWIIIYLSL